MVLLIKTFYVLFGMRNNPNNFFGSSVLNYCNTVIGGSAI